MLFTSQLQVSLAEGDLQAAEDALNLMMKITEEDDPRVLQLQDKIDRYRVSEAIAPDLIESFLKAD